MPIRTTATATAFPARPRIVRDSKSGELTLGRFGWKAQTPSIRQQAADAFAGDIGISTPEVPKHWGDCTAGGSGLPAPCRTACRSGSARSRRRDPIMDLVTFYSQNLAVPARRDIDKPDVLARQEAVLRERLRLLPHAEIRHPARRAQQGAVLPADLALFRLPAARHGRRASPTASRSATPAAANGARRRCGASG